MARQIIDHLEADYDSEDIYRSFFRYAVDLLFTPELGFDWTACDSCPHLLGGGKTLVGQPCTFCAREGRSSLRRRLEWRDLAPRG